MLEWNDCIKIYDPSTSSAGYPENVDSKKYTSYLKYLKQLSSGGRQIKNTVWYDKFSNICFGADQDFFINPGDFSFFHQKETFLTHEPWGKNHLYNVLGQHLGDSIKASSELMIHDHKEFEKYKDKNILLVGAGPSSKEIEWESMNLDYDYLWTCNNFYKNEKLLNLKIDAALLGPVVDLKDPELIERLNKDDTFCLFEGGISPFRTAEELKVFKNTFQEKVSFFHLRYFSKIGTMPRMLCLASMLGAKNIYFVGIDGYPGKTGSKYEHAFEGDKKSHQGRVFSYDLHRRQYVLLWEYLLNLDTQAQYQNLGEGVDGNLTTDISKNHFPLNIT